MPRKSKNPATKQQSPKQSKVQQIDEMGSRHLINSEYRRGFIEGQRSALRAFGELLDTMLERHNEVERLHYAGSCLVRSKVNFMDCIQPKQQQPA